MKIMIRGFMDVIDTHGKLEIQREVHELQSGLVRLQDLIGALRADRISESSTTAIKPLTPKQLVARAERDRNRSQQIQGIQKKTQERISALRSKIGK